MTRTLLAAPPQRRPKRHWPLPDGLEPDVALPEPKPKPSRRASRPAPPPPRRTDRVTVALTVAVAVVAGLAAAAWWDERRDARLEATGRECLSRATAAAQAIFSYDYRTFDASITNAGAFVTGEFAREYQQTTAGLKATAVQQQAVVRAEVSAASIVQASPERVELLLFVNQYRRNVAIDGEKVDQNRVVLTMVPGAGGCRVEKAAAI